MFNHVCKSCNQNYQTKKQKTAGKCQLCNYKASGERMRKYKNSLTKEEKTAQGKSGHSAIRNHAEAVKKQWNTIKSLPKQEYDKFCQKRSERMKKVWAEQYSQETKNEILTKLVSSNNKARSIGSDRLRLEMDNAGITGFLSESCFHGFFPDEINHELKIIVEYYGDVYHCNPKRFKDPTEYCTFIQRTVEEQWKRDKIRLACFYKHGYTVVIVWESDFHKDPKKQLQRIQNEIDKKRTNK